MPRTTKNRRTESPEAFIEQLEKIEAKVIDKLLELADDCQQLLQKYEGATFGSYEQNKCACKALQATLDFLNLKPVCPKTNNLCVIRLKSGKSGGNGLFELRQRVDGRYTSNFSSTTLPALQLQLVRVTTESAAKPVASTSVNEPLESTPIPFKKAG